VPDLGDDEALRVVGDSPPVDHELAHRAIVAPCPADVAEDGRTMPQMLGAVLLVAALAALVATGWCVASCLARDSAITAALVVPLVAYAEIVCLAFVLSAFGWLGRAGFLAGIVACVAVAVAVWNALGRPRAPFPRGLGQLREALRDPALAVLAALVALAFLYMTILALATPQLDWDSNAYHLPRAVLWLQQGGIGEIAGASDVRLSWAPPGAEIAIAFTMAVARSDRYVALPQLVALVVAVVAVVGIARRLGFAIRPALFAGLVFGCLPIVLLQSATTFNDLVVAALLLATLYLALGGTRRDAALAAAAVALALVTKLTAALALPLLVVAALLIAPRAWRCVTASAAAGALVGSLWYVSNRVRTGSFDGGWAETFGQEPDRSAGEVLLRAERYTLDFFDLSGFAGDDRWWLPIVGGALGAAALVLALRGAPRRRLAAALAAAALVVTLPWLVEGARVVAVRLFAYALRAVGSGDRLSELARDPSTAASPFSSWYGAVFALLWVVSLVVAARELARRRLRVGVLALLLAPPAFALLFALGTINDGARGRFFAFPVGMAAAAFPLAYRFGAIRIAVPAAAAATIAVVVVHSEPRPLGVELLEPVRTPAVWGDDLFEAYDAMARMFGDHPGWVRLDRALAGTDRLAVADRWEFPLYPLFGDGNRRRLVLVRDPRRTPAGVGTLLVTARARRPRCDEPWRPRLVSPDGYALYERSAAGHCVDGRATDG
jgi:4-amino-4-deoxy-L-arabinose transferase-like glycosyltransferase